MDFGCEGGGGESFSGSVKEGKFVTKIFLADNVEWTEVLKICEKWCLLNDVKTSIKQREIKDLVAHLTNFYTRITIKTWSIYNVNSGFIFHLILVGTLSILILFLKSIGGGWGGFCLMEKIC